MWQIGILTFYENNYPRQQKWSGPDLAQTGVKVWPRPGNLAWASPGVNHGPGLAPAWQNRSMPWAYPSDARPLTMACHGLTRPGLAKRIDTMPLPDQAWQTGSIPWLYQGLTRLGQQKIHNFFYFEYIWFFLLILHLHARIHQFKKFSLLNRYKKEELIYFLDMNLLKICSYVHSKFYEVYYVVIYFWILEIYLCKLFTF